VFSGQLATVHPGLPLALSRRGRRHGWRDGGRLPSWAYLSGLVPLLAGGALLSWVCAEHFAAAADKSWAINRGPEPEYLLTAGPYRFGRNPMFVGGVAIWGGWAVLLGSAPVSQAWSS
jgi:protein-S-isoprenylcysteine O-methyltransferase Ste14